MGTDKDNAVSMKEAIEKRSAIIVRTSIVGIVANLFLVAFKLVVGLVSNSIAVVLDALNNLSDAVSSIVTIIGSKLSSMKPSKRHPMGYGRIEYMSAMIVAFLILYVGLSAGISSIRKVFDHEVAEYSTVSLVIIGIAVIVKIFLGRYVKAKGQQVNSQALVASGYDAMFDAIISFSVFVSAMIFIIFGISLEAYVGIVISVFIIKSGIEMMLDTVNDILGRRTDAEMSKKIKQITSQVPEVLGAYDLFVNNYGPDRDYASIHIELPDTMTVDQVDRITRQIQQNVYSQTGVILTGVGVYSHNTKNDEAAAIRDAVRRIVLENDWAIQMHGFHVDIAEKVMRFDVVFSFDIDAAEGQQMVYDQVLKAYPDYDIAVTADVDLND